MSELDPAVLPATPARDRTRLLTQLESGAPADDEEVGANLRMDEPSGLGAWLTSRLDGFRLVRVQDAAESG